MKKQMEDVTVQLSFGQATVSQVDSIYKLSWTDGINKWAEYYPTFPMAMLRLAVLIQAQEEITYGNMFAHDGLVFCNYADTFFRLELRD